MPIQIIAKEGWLHHLFIISYLLAVAFIYAATAFTLAALITP